MSVDLTKLARLFVALDKVVSAKVPKEISYKNDQLCDGISKDILRVVLEKRRDDGITEIPSRYLTQLCCTRLCRVRTHVHLMAQFAIIRVNTEWNTEGQRCYPWRIEVNPAVMDYLTLKRELTPSGRSRIVNYLADIGISRLVSDKPIQGFRNDCLFGHSEPNHDKLDERNFTAYIDKISKNANQKKKERDEELARWRKMDADFVLGCADIWKRGQVAFGFSAVEPIWFGDPSKMAPKARNERSNLTKIFRAYGTQITSIAWMVFNSVKPERDHNDSIMFVPERSFQQFPSPDKRPEAFVKYFNNILGSEEFKYHATDGYSKTQLDLSAIYPRIWAQGPEDGDTVESKLGYALGSSGVSLDSFEP